MSPFSASDAALEGFQVLRRQWRVVLGWCLFAVLAFVGLVVVAFIAIAVATLSRSPEQAQAVGGLVGGLILGLGGVAIQWVVLAALYRMTLRPDAPPGTFYLRLSRDEVRLFGLWIVILILFMCLITAGFLVVRW